VRTVMEQLVNGFYTCDPNLFRPIYDNLLYGNGTTADPYFVLKDFDAYRAIQSQIDSDYANPSVWWKKAGLNIAAAGVFSSDRTIAEYNAQIWNLPRQEFGKVRLFRTS